jgi:transcriptional regulator with XRE-family HTH domain
MGRRVKRFLKELKAWCAEERGRQRQLAEAAEATKQTVSNWFAERQEPTAEQLLAIQEFLKGARD